jgi:hypothetical protein
MQVFLVFIALVLQKNKVNNNIMNKIYLNFIVICGLMMASGCGIDFFTLDDDYPGDAAKSGNPNSSTGCNPNEAGKFSGIKFTQPLDSLMIVSGQSIAGAKCSGCHKFTDENLIGPGWKGITKRRDPEWIMNFITNTCPILRKDPHSQSEISTCQVRTPRPYITDTQARQVLEFMRKNDSQN